MRGVLRTLEEEGRSRAGLRLLLGLLGLAVAAAGLPQVLVVDAAAHHGLQPEDRVVEWRVRATNGLALAGGPIRDPLELVVARTEHAPRGEFVLVLADGRTSGPVRFGDSLVTRPELPPGLLRLYREASAPAEDEDAAQVDERVARWVELAERLGRLNRVADGLWAWGGASATASSPEEVLDFVDRARAGSTALPGRLAAFLRLGEKALRGLRQPPDPHRRALLEEALALDEARRPGGLAVAADLYELGAMDGRDAHPVLGEQRLREAVRIYEATNPDSLYLAEAMYRLSLALSTQGRLEEELEWNRRELALVERIGVGGEPLVRAMQAVGGTLTQLGRIFEAREALMAASRAASTDASVPDGLHAAIEQTLAVVSLDLGDVVASEVHALRALELVRRRGRGSRAEVLQVRAGSTRESHHRTATLRRCPGGSPQSSTGRGPRLRRARCRSG